MSRLRVLDLFSGAAGGWSLGFHRAGAKTVAACEIDPWRRAVFSQINPGVVMYDDVRQLTADRIVSDLGYLPNIILGSPPCQDASLANTNGKGVDGERTGLFFDAMRIVREVRPDWVCFENVPGLRTRGYDRVHDEMEQAGYTVWPLVVGAVHAGAPHLRKRVWIIAADLSRIGCGPRRPWRFNSGNPRKPEQTFYNADAASLRGVEIARRKSNGIGAGASTNSHEAKPEWGNSYRGRLGWGQEASRDWDSSHPNEARLEIVGRERSDSHEKRSAFERNGTLSAWDHWNSGAPDLSRVDDGLSEALASRRGLGRECLSAFGDAVIPQITEAIARTILHIGGAQE